MFALGFQPGLESPPWKRAGPRAPIAYISFRRKSAASVPIPWNPAPILLHGYSPSLGPLLPAGTHTFKTCKPLTNKEAIRLKAPMGAYQFSFTQPLFILYKFHKVKHYFCLLAHCSRSRSSQCSVGTWWASFRWVNKCMNKLNFPN